MSFQFISPAISTSNIKMQWREQYVTSGVNKKSVGVIPFGIYRGFTLGTSGSANTVTVNPDSVHQDHLLVYETADGFSLTFRDPAATVYSLALTDASLLSQTVLICVFINYQEDVATTANFYAYTTTEFAALTAALQSELIILGTVINPASGVIAGSAITTNQRTVASFNQTTLLWRPLLINSGFERALDTRVITGSEVEGWAATSNWQITSSDVSTGIRCIEYNIGGSGTYTDNIRQYIGHGVIAGQQILVKISKKVIGAATGGTGQITVGFTGSDGGSPTEATSAVVINATDSVYQTINVYFVAPSGAISISYIGFSLTGAVYGSSGVKIRIDNFSALLQPLSVDDQLSVFNKRWRETFASSLILEDIASTSYGDTAALLKFNKTLPPTGEGTLLLARKDQDYSGGNQPPSFTLDGRILSLASKLLSTSADALKARITASSSVAGGATYTLIMEHGQDGQTVGTYTNPVVRLYISPLGHMEITSNALWGGTTWSADVTGQDSAILILKKDGLQFESLSGTTDGTGYIENGTPWANPWYAVKSTVINGGTTVGYTFDLSRAALTVLSPNISLGNLNAGSSPGSIVAINGLIHRSTTVNGGVGISRLFNCSLTNVHNPNIDTVTYPAGAVAGAQIAGSSTVWFPIPRIEFDEQVTTIIIRPIQSMAGANVTYSYDITDDPGTDALTGVFTSVVSISSTADKVTLTVAPTSYSMRRTFWLRVATPASGGPSSGAIALISYLVAYTKVG